MEQIKRILENQNEVKYLVYFIVQDDKTGQVDMKIGTCDITKIYKFRDENACLNKLIDVLFELKKLEKWALGRGDKKK